MSIKTNSQIFQKDLLIIQSTTYATVESYQVPQLTVEQVQGAFDNFKQGRTVLVKDNLGFINLPVIEASTIDGTAVKLLFNGIMILNYKRSGTSVVIEPTQIGGLETFVFKGYVSLTQPATANEGELWLASATLPTTFPVQVKRYTEGAWSSTFESYTPKSLETWQNQNVTPSSGHFWFANTWHNMNIDTAPDDVTMELNASRQLQLKDLGHDASKMSAVTIGAGLEKSTDGKTIQHVAKVTGRAYSPVVVTNSGATTTEGGSFKSKKFTDDNSGHRTTADSDDVTVGLEQGLRMFGGKIGHNNQMTAQTTAKVWKTPLDKNGHHTGTQTGYDVQTTLPTTPADTDLFTGKLIDNTYQKKAKTVSATLTSSGWNASTHKQSVTVSGVTTSNHIIVSIASNATKAQIEEYGKCIVFATAQASNSVTFTALSGTEPTVNIPITVMILEA